MAELKTAIKDARAMIGSQRYEDALLSLKAYVDNGVEDYMLYSLLGLVYFHINQPTDAKKLYEKAIKLDNTQHLAWQGLFKVYESGKLPADELGVEVCNRMLSSDKRDRALEIKRNILLDIGRLEELNTDLGSSTELCEKILRKLMNKNVLSTTENDLVKQSFNIVSTEIRSLPALHQFYCEFLYKSKAEWKTQFDRLLDNADGTFTFNSWVFEKLLELLCIDYFMCASFSRPVASLSWCDATAFGKQGDLLTLFNYLSADDMNGAWKHAEALPASLVNKHPISLVCCRLYESFENWDKVLRLLSSFVSDKEVTLRINWMKIRALIEKEDLQSAVGYFNQNSLVFANEFLLEWARVHFVSAQNEAWRSSVPDNKIELLRVFELFQSKNLVDLKQEVQTVSFDENSWKELLLVADYRIEVNLDATTLLVKAAKLNSRSSRVFFLLGKALHSKNPIKSKSCLERALKMMPSNAEYVREFDDLMISVGAADKDRLPHLKHLAQNSKPIWLRKRLAGIAISMGDRNTAIDELQHILRFETDDISCWALLAESYSARGHLQAAVNAYQHILTLDPHSDYAIPLIQILCRLRKDEDALEHCLRFKEIRDLSSPSLLAINILEAQVIYRLVRDTREEERISHINRALGIVSEAVELKPRLSLLYKVAGDLLLSVAEYNDETISRFKLPPSWNGVTKSNILKQAAVFYSVALELNRDDTFAWSDLSCVLLRRAITDGDKEVAKKATVCIKKAITLGGNATIRSTLWSRLAEATRISGGSWAFQQHCLVRSLQLNKANDEAWLRLAILYFSLGLADKSQSCFETAIKYNPQSAAAWCGYAAKAESSSHSVDAMDMYRHSLSVCPLALAVQKYTAYLCAAFRKKTEFDPSTVMIDFQNVLELKDRYPPSDRLQIHIAVLAEMFGYYDESIEILKGFNGQNVQTHLDRSMCKIASDKGKNSTLSKLSSMNLEELFQLLLANNETYNNLFAAIQTTDEEFSKIVKEKRKTISIPLVVSAVINFKLSLSDTSVNALHDLLPRHELIDVFPTVLPDGMDSELKYLQQDGEEPFRYRHHIAKPLFDELQKLREISSE